MPIYPRHIKVVIRGIHVGTPETWSYSFHLWPYENILPEIIETVQFHAEDLDASTVAAALVAFHASANFATTSQVTDWRAYDIGTNGRMVGNPSIYTWSGTSGPKGTTTYKFPPQVALVATLEAEDRGLARFGRCYLPTPSLALSGDLKISSVDAAAVATGFKTMLRAIQDAVPGAIPAKLVNVSGRATAGQTDHQFVKWIKVGRVLDTVRSRRTAMVEDRQIIDYDT